jgi:hypothetical protein
MKPYMLPIRPARKGKPARTQREFHFPTQETCPKCEANFLRICFVTPYPDTFMIPKAEFCDLCGYSVQRS